MFELQVVIAELICRAGGVAPTSVRGRHCRFVAKLSHRGTGNPGAEGTPVKFGTAGVYGVECRRAEADSGRAYARTLRRSHIFVVWPSISTAGAFARSRRLIRPTAARPKTNRGPAQDRPAIAATPKKLSRESARLTARRRPADRSRSARRCTACRCACRSSCRSAAAPPW